MDSQTDPLAQAIGVRVKRERIARGWTLDQLAERSGVSRRMIINVEQAAANPSLETLLRISDALGMGLPALVEAARVDGASMIRTFWSIALPAARPAAATLALFTFIGSWNSFFWPSVVLRSQLTMPLVVPQLKGVYTSDTGLVMAGVFLVASPLLIVLIAAGKQLVSGVMAGAVKG